MRTHWGVGDLKMGGLIKNVLHAIVEYAFIAENNFSMAKNTHKNQNNINHKYK